MWRVEKKIGIRNFQKCPLILRINVMSLGPDVDDFEIFFFENRNISDNAFLAKTVFYLQIIIRITDFRFTFFDVFKF